MTKLITFTLPSDLVAQAIADVKDLNQPLTVTQRKTAQVVIKSATALLQRLNVIKTPSFSEKMVLKFRKEDRHNLNLWNKAAVFLALFTLNALVKVGEEDNEYATVFGIELDTIQDAIDIAKVVLFEELIDLGLDKLDIENWIKTVGAEVSNTTEA